MSEDTFTRELERRAEAVHVAPLTFDGVRDRALGIRRRRRAAAAAAVAAAVATAIVLPTVLTGGPDRSAPDPAPEPDLPTVPGTSVLHDGTLTRPDGSTVTIGVDNLDVMSFGVLTDGRVVVATQDPSAVTVYSPEGDRERRYAVQVNAVTMSADDRLAAWIGEDYGVKVLESGAAAPVDLPAVSPGGEDPGGIDVLLGSTCLDAGCSVLAGDGTTTMMQAGARGTHDLETSEPLRVTDVSPDGSLWAVQYPDERDPQYGCVGLYDPTAGRMTARSCDAANLRFSPDGQHLLSRFAENVGQSSELTVLDLELERVLEYAPEGQTIKEAAWADGHNVYATVADLRRPSQWSLRRVPLDGGNPALVAGPVDGPDPELASEFLLTR